MSSLGSVVTAIGGATGDNGTYSLEDLVKSPAIQNSLGTLIGNYNSQVSNDSTDLSQYIKNYMAGNTQAAQDTGQETNAIDRYYNGDVARQLADLRAQQSQLGNQSVAQALAYQRGNQNRALVSGGGGGDSSYQNRLGVGTAANLNLANNMALLGQNRADINQVNQGQLGLIGQRTSLANALAARPLAPIQAGQQVIGGDISNLSGLTGISNANNMFGAQYNPSMAEYGGAITGGMMGAAATVAGGFMGGGSGGMGGGGGGGSTSGGQPAIPMGQADFYGGAPTPYTGYPAYAGYSGWGMPYGGAGGGSATTLDYYNNMMGYTSPSSGGGGWDNINLGY